MHEHGYSLTELEAMIPWERDIYIMLFIEKQKEEAEKQRLKQHANQFK